jgi:hypothetical protein
MCLYKERKVSVVSYRHKEGHLARRGSILGLTIKVVKAIDKAGKQAARDAERRQKARVREQAQIDREYQKKLKEREREAIRAEKDRANRAKQEEREALSAAKDRANLAKQTEKEALSAVNDRANRAKQAEKLNAARAKQRFKDSLSDSQEEYIERCSERAALRKQFINAVIR